MNQQVALLLLSAMGYDADVVADGNKAIEAVQARAYDVVLMDVAMPGTDGLSATKAIRSLGAGVNQPYIVALTAHAFPGDADNCIESGMDDYVAKPVDRAQLARALNAGALRAAPGGAARPSGSGLAVTTQPPPAPGRGPVATTSPEADLSSDDGFDPALPREILAEFGPEPLNRLVAIFRTEATRLVGLAETSVAGGDIEQAERAAHTLKSSAANLGARGLYENCSRLEALARSGTLEGAADLTASMAELLTKALAHLDAMVAGSEVA